MLADLIVSREGSSNSFSIEGTRSKRPSTINLISRKMCHSLFRKWIATARSNSVDVNKAEMTKVRDESVLPSIDLSGDKILTATFAKAFCANPSVVRGLHVAAVDEAVQLMMAKNMMIDS